MSNKTIIHQNPSFRPSPALALSGPARSRIVSHTHGIRHFRPASAAVSSRPILLYIYIYIYILVLSHAPSGARHSSQDFRRKEMCRKLLYLKHLFLFLALLLSGVLCQRLLCTACTPARSSPQLGLIPSETFPSVRGARLGRCVPPGAI